jgi:hypothetical protein
MKRLIAAVLSTLVIAGSPSAVKAQSNSVDSSASNLVTLSNVDSQLTPVDLAFFAYRGYLKDQGIPSGQLLAAELEAGNVSAKDIVQAAIKAHRLSEQMLTDPGYLNSLESALDLFLAD